MPPVAWIVVSDCPHLKIGDGPGFSGRPAEEAQEKEGKM
jgi:hypothetical protein